MFVSNDRGNDWSAGKDPNKNNEKETDKDDKWTVHEIGYGEFKVRDFKRNTKVDYHNHTCECRKWKLSGLPCSHAIAVASYLRQTDYAHLASHYFSTSTYRATYAEVIQPVGPPETWVMPSGYQLMKVKAPLIVNEVLVSPVTMIVSLLVVRTAEL